MQNARIDGKFQITEYIQVEDGDTVQVKSIYGRHKAGARFEAEDIIKRIKKDWSFGRLRTSGHGEAIITKLTGQQWGDRLQGMGRIAVECKENVNQTHRNWNHESIS